MSEEQKQGEQALAGDGNPEVGEELTPEELNQDIKFEENELDIVDDDTSKKIKTAVAQKKHWREKHDKVFKEFEEYKKEHSISPTPPKKPQEKKEEGKKDNDVDHRIAILELQRDNPGLNLDRDAADTAIAFAKMRGQTPQEVIASGFFQAYLKEEAEKKKAEGGTPDPSHRSGQPTEDWNRYIRDPSLIKSLNKDKYQELRKWMAENSDKVPKE